MMPTLSSQWDPVDVSMCKEMFLFILLVFFKGMQSLPAQQPLKRYGVYDEAGR